MASNTYGKYLEVPSESAILDDKITRNEIRYVYQCLGKVSKDWDTIGVYLQVPQDMLDNIEQDKKKTTSKLLAMIDAWICNKSDQCTWRTLATALYELGHSAAATAVREKAKEVVTKCKHVANTQQEQTIAVSNYQWDEDTQKQKQLLGNFITELLKLSEEEQQLKEKLCEVLKIPFTDVTLNGITQHVQGILVFPCELKDVSDILHSIAQLFQKQTSVLQDWADELSQEMAGTYHHQDEVTKDKLDLERKIVELTKEKRKIEGLAANHSNNHMEKLVQEKTENEIKLQDVTSKLLQCINDLDSVDLDQYHSSHIVNICQNR